jgi:hypothetical protein
LIPKNVENHAKMDKFTYETRSELRNGGPSMVYNRNEAENEDYGGRNAAIAAEHVNEHQYCGRSEMY